MNSITLPTPDLQSLQPWDYHDINTSPQRRTFESRFALEQLESFANDAQPARFAATMAAIFGYGVPASHYVALQTLLCSGQFPMPRYVLRTDATIADYDNLSRTIGLQPAVLDNVMTAPERSWELLAILLHEFGHHVDNVLRHDIMSQDGAAPIPADATAEEGSRYAQRMALIHLTDCPPYAEIATCRNADSVSISVSLNMRQALQRIADTQSSQAWTSLTGGQRESFEAGNGEPGKFTHENIENVLQPLGFRSEERDIIYFGNWMRDYSQLLDPKTVRPEHMPKSFPQVFSRKALTQIVDVLSIRKFGHLRGVPGLVNVTPERLGVYRPSEHIDNPKEASTTQAFDPARRDPNFERPVLPGDAMLEVDPDTSMKRYIYRSVEVMRHGLETGLTQGRTADGLKSFGSALHILEDFFAHSNFIELSLIKAGHRTVLPWTSKAPCKWELPLVTGTFGSIDIVASMAGVVGDIFFPERSLKFDPTRAGHRSEWDKMMLIILSEHHNPEYLETFEQFLIARDKWASWEGSEYVEMFFWFTGTPARALLNAFNAMMRGFLRLAGSRIDDYQTIAVDNPNTSGSTDPTHSQLSKDHDDHPLHELAALLAKEAVHKVAQEMLKGWNGDENADPAAVATRLICHPMDCSWQHGIVSKWADGNPGRVGTSTSSTDLKVIHRSLESVGQSMLDKLEKESTEVVTFFFTPSQDRDLFFNLLASGNPLVNIVNGVVNIVNRKP
jgi:hypothetical protein